MQHSHVMHASLCLLAVLMWPSVGANSGVLRRCGVTWQAAYDTCDASLCPGNTSLECASGEDCFDVPGAPTCAAPTRRCGTTWSAAANDCDATECPNNTSLECAAGEDCFDIDAASDPCSGGGSSPTPPAPSTPPSGLPVVAECGAYKRCGATWQAAYDDCYAPHCPGNTDSECPGSDKCFTVNGKDCGSNLQTSHDFSFDAAGSGGCPSSAVSGMTQAKLTAYSSVPSCCFDSTGAQQNGDTECSDYNGCAYIGQFANGETLTEPEVRCADIAAVFDGSVDWATTYEDKTMRLVVCHNGAVVNDFTVEVKDTCGDSDCNGCCSANSAGYGGKLVDLEINTLYRHVGTSVPDSIYFEVL